MKPQKLWEVICVGFPDSGRNKKSIRQTERRGRENVIDWDEDLGCLAVLNLSLPLLPQTLYPLYLPPSPHPSFLTSFISPAWPYFLHLLSLFSSSTLLSPAPPSSSHFLFCGLSFYLQRPTQMIIYLQCLLILQLCESRSHKYLPSPWKKKEAGYWNVNQAHYFGSLCLQNMNSINFVHHREDLLIFKFLPLPFWIHVLNFYFKVHFAGITLFSLCTIPLIFECLVLFSDSLHESRLVQKTWKMKIHTYDIVE